MTNGSVDVTGGEQEGSKMADRKYRLLVKYKQQVRYLLGPGAVLLPDGTVEGRRAPLKEYTDR